MQDVNINSLKLIFFKNYSRLQFEQSYWSQKKFPLKEKPMMLLPITFKSQFIEVYYSKTIQSLHFNNLINHMCFFSSLNTRLF
jgi:hypothetical protein